MKRLWFPALLVLTVVALAAAQSIRDRSVPVRGADWTCSVDNIGATLTLCQSARPGLRLHLTDIVIQSTTGTAGQFLIRTGTGTNCGTGTVSLLPGAAAVPRLAYSGNTLFGSVTALSTPVIAPTSTDICIICTATNTCSVQLLGYAAP